MGQSTGLKHFVKVIEKVHRCSLTLSPLFTFSILTKTTIFPLTLTMCFELPKQSTKRKISFSAFKISECVAEKHLIKLCQSQI